MASVLKARYKAISQVHKALKALVVILANANTFSVLVAPPVVLASRYLIAPAAARKRKPLVGKSSRKMTSYNKPFMNLFTVLVCFTQLMESAVYVYSLLCQETSEYYET